MAYGHCSLGDPNIFATESPVSAPRAGNPNLPVAASAVGPPQPSPGPGSSPAAASPRSCSHWRTEDGLQPMGSQDEEGWEWPSISCWYPLVLCRLTVGS